MRIIVAIHLLLFPVRFFAQSDYYSIDSKVNDIPFADAKILAAQLSALGKTDKEKVRAIFRWITEHIDYNVGIYNHNRKNTGLYYQEPDDSIAALPSLNERVAAKVLYKKIAFCDGYSRLFKTLCDHAGITCEIISGFARTNMNHSGRFGVNHIWNAVYLDSAWQLLDVTWASGFVSFANEYVRRYDDFYFLTPPGDFIRDHYPADTKWTLLSEIPVYREFKQSPFRYPGYAKAGITSYFPLKGIIEGASGDTVRIELQSRSLIRSFTVSTSPIPDTTQNSQTVSADINGDKLSFNYIISSANDGWLYVFCNDELAMRYRLNLKTDMAAAKHQELQMK